MHTATAPESTTRSRTNLLVCHLPRTADDHAVWDAFRRFGVVTSSMVVRDIHTGASRRMAYVRFATPAEAQAALTALHHSTWCGRGSCRVTVRFAHARHDDAPAGAARAAVRELFVRNVPLDVTEAQLRAVASRCGGVARVELRADTQPDPQRPRRIAFITFAEDGAAEAALYALHHTAPFVSCEDVPLLCKLKEEYLPLPPCSVRVGKNRYHHDPYRFTVLPLPTAMAGAVM